MIPLTDTLSFRFGENLNTSSSIQLKVDLGWKTVLSQIQKIEVLPKISNFRITYQSQLTPQGFSQGGKVKIRFDSDTKFDGLCTVIAHTDNAYNFALTYMGSESKLKVFLVNRGNGQGEIALRWNGIFNVTVACASEGFKAVGKTSVITLRANF